MSLFFPGLGGTPARQFAPTRRKSSRDLGYLPPQRIGNRSYLHLHTISPTVLRTSWAVFQEAMGGGLAKRAPVDHQVAAVAAVVATRLLARGYVEAMRSILARRIPDFLGLAEITVRTVGLDLRQHDLRPDRVGQLNQRFCPARICWR